MVTFLSILSGLLAINAVLLIFSVNGAKDRFRKPVQKISQSSVTKFFHHESSETEYKKAV